MANGLVRESCTKEGRRVWESGNGDEVFVKNAPVERDGNLPQQENCYVSCDQRTDSGCRLGNIRKKPLGESGRLPVERVCIGRYAYDDSEEEWPKQPLSLGNV